jgi:sarcosine oxidase gamma subunit
MVATPELRLRRLEALNVLALRHLPAGGTEGVRAALQRAGLPAPPPPGMLAGSDPFVVWCSPSEWRLVASERTCIDAVAAALKPGGDDAACAVDLSAGVHGLDLAGSGIDDLMSRLMDAASIAAPGRATRGRLIDATVLQLRPAPGRMWLIVDLALEGWLAQWIGHTLQASRA